jgi:hypothetical protein
MIGREQSDTQAIRDFAILRQGRGDTDKRARWEQMWTDRQTGRWTIGKEM